MNFSYESIYTRRYGHEHTGNLMEPPKAAQINDDRTSNNTYSALREEKSSKLSADAIEVIDRSKYLSENYQIDTDIHLYSDYVRVTVWLPYSFFDGSVKQALSELISRANSLSFQADIQNTYRFILSMEFSR